MPEARPRRLISMPTPMAAGMENKVIRVENMSPQERARAMGATKGS